LFTYFIERENGETKVDIWPHDTQENSIIEKHSWGGGFRLPVRK
jgi:hypothetical protein